MKTKQLNCFLFSVFLMICSGLVEAKVTAYIDKTAPLNEDFYRHTNGLLLKQKQNFTAIDKCPSRDAIVLNVALECIHGGMGNNIFNKLYNSLMFIPTGGLSKQSIQPSSQQINEIFSKIDLIKDKSQIPSLVADIEKMGVRTILELGIKSIYSSNGSIGPSFTHDIIQRDAILTPYKNNNPDFTLSIIFSGDFLNPPEHEEWMKSNIQQIKRYFYLLGVSKQLNSEEIGIGLDLYKSIFISSYKKENITSYPKNQLQDIMKKNGWDGYFESSGLFSSNVDSISIPANFPSYLQTLNNLFKNNNLDAVKFYLKVRVASELGFILSQRGYEKQVIGFILRFFGDDNLIMGMCLKTDIENAQNVFTNVKAAYHDAIDATSWMSTQVKNLAKQKLDEMTIRIDSNYSADYSSIVMSDDDPLGNILHLVQARHKSMIETFGTKVAATPGEAAIRGVSYELTKNIIFIPLEEIIYMEAYVKEGDPVIYGGFGAAIGHEISHAFDDIGRNYYKGKPIQWMPNESYNDKAKALSKQYYEYSGATHNPLIEPEYDLSGNMYSAEELFMQTSREDMADNLGLAMSYNAYQTFLKRHPKEEKKSETDTISDNQLFYYAYAYSYRGYEKCRPGDVHSNPDIRTNGALKNQPGFYKAFESTNFKHGNMYLPPEKRIDFTTIP